MFEGFVLPTPSMMTFRSRPQEVLNVLSIQGCDCRRNMKAALGSDGLRMHDCISIFSLLVDPV